MISRNLFLEKDKKLTNKNSGIRFTTDWSTQLIKLLKKHKLYDVSLQNVRNWENMKPSEYASDVVADFRKDEIHLQLTFHLRNIGTRDKDKWSVDVSLNGVTPKRGSFRKTVTGKDVVPNKVITILDNIFDLRYSQKR